MGAYNILTKFQQKIPWCYFDAAPTLANLNGDPESGDLEHPRDLVLVEWINDNIAVG